MLDVVKILAKKVKEGKGNPVAEVVSEALAQGVKSMLHFGMVRGGK